MSAARKRSPLWNHFEPDGSKKAKCCYCSQVLSIPNQNVGNLGRHMKSKHPTVPLVLERQTPTVFFPAAPESNADHTTGAATTSTAAVLPINIVPPAAPVSIQLLRTQNSQPSMREFTVKPLPPRRAEIIDRQLMTMISKEYHPLRLVEDKEFRNFVMLLNPSYSLLTRKTLSENILSKQYEKLLEISKKKVEAASAVCVSTDGWTSIKNESFVAMTAHYVSYDEAQIKLETVLLGCIEHTDRHTAENLCDFLKSILDDWKLTNKVTAIASDNAANIVAAVKKGNWRHIACFAHSINRAVQAALEHINPTLIKVKEIVEYFKRSTLAQNKLKEVKKQLNVPDLKLKQDVKTRWNSTYEMLTRILAVKDAVITTLALLRSDLVLSSEDWQVIEEAIPILMIFYDVTTEICTEKNVTLSKVAPLYKIISNFIKGLLKNSHNSPRLPQIQSLIATLDEQLDRRFSHLESHEMYAEATILDPRFKNRGFIHDINFRNSLHALKLKVGRRLQQQQPPNPQLSTSHEAAVTAPAASKWSIWEEFDREVAALHPENATAAGIVELDRYMQEPMLARKENPLIWWHQRKNVYPHLFRYMLKRLNLLATSVPCERIFSKAGYTMTERRSRLTSSKLSQLIFLSANSHLSDF